MYGERTKKIWDNERHARARQSREKKKQCYKINQICIWHANPLGTAWKSRV